MELNAKKMMNSLSKGNSILKAIQENDRKHLQKVLTMMLRDLMKVTDKYGIVMPVAYGNVLGAVRHHGFIPWDDDLDVYMMRKDWEKFKKVFDKELGYKYILEGPNTNELCPKNTFPKVYLKGTEFTDIYDVNTPYQHGIYIDIFITDYVPSSKLLQKIDGFVSKVIKFGINSQTYYQYPNPVMEKFMHQSGGAIFYLWLRKTFGLFFSFASHRVWCNWFDKFYGRYSSKSHKITVPVQNYNLEVMDESVIYPVTVGDYEGIKVYLPGKTHEYLVQNYGPNYMEIPPVEKREDHMIVNLDFGKY